MSDKVSEHMVEALTQYNEEMNTTLSDYLKPQMNEAEYYIAGGGAGLAVNIGNSPQVMAAGSGMSALGGYLYSKAKKHQQGRKAAANS